MPPFNPNAAATANSGVFGLPHTPEESAIILIPVPYEATTSYGGGSANGPRAILDASRQVDLFDVETGKPYERGICMLPEDAEVRAWNDTGKRFAKPVIESGGLDVSNPALVKMAAEVNSSCEKMNDWVYRTCREWLGRGKRLGVVGGDHSISFGSIRAHAERYPGMGILHLDAHADLRDAYEGFTWSHASIMFNVIQCIPQVKTLVQVGIRDLCEAEQDVITGSKGRIVTWYDSALAQRKFEGGTWQKTVDEIVAGLPERVYLSFDIDGLDPVLCPHTGTPVPGGLAFREACALVAGVVRSGRTIIGLDLTEVAPGDDDLEWDGNVGARLLYKMVGWMAKK